VILILTTSVGNTFSIEKNLGYYQWWYRSIIIKNSSGKNSCHIVIELQGTF